MQVFPLKMLAMTNNLITIDASVFAAQETNIHWATTNLIYSQSHCSTPHITLAMSTSAEKSKNWHKPGGTLLMVLSKWMSWVTA